MSLHTGEAILLDVFDLRDRDRIVTFLTADRGKSRGVAPGARRKYSRFAGQLQPLAKVRMTWFEKEGRDLVRISDVDLVRPTPVLQSSLEGILLGSYLADQMVTLAQENEAGESLFRLLDACVDALEAGADRGRIARYYEVWMLRLAGLFPPPRECPWCGRAFAPDEDAVLIEEAIVCRTCAGGPRAGAAVSAAALEFLRRTARESPAAMALQATTPAVLGEVEALASRLRRAFLGHEVKSYEVMQRTLGPAGLG